MRRTGGAARHDIPLGDAALPRSHYPIRAQLFALVAGVVLPLAGMLAYTIFADARHAIAQAKSAARALAAVTAADAARVLNSNQDALRLSPSCSFR